MAGNKFATILSRNTSRITVILVYAVLEWILIILLLFNSLFAYAIGKFASFFGLKPPCPLCCRVDHVLEPEKKGGSSYADTMCETHAKEISRLGYCLNHGRLLEACQTCEDCSLERRCSQGSSLIASVSLVSQVDDGDDKELQCSCCGVRLDDGFYSKYFFKNGLFKPAWDVLEYTNKGTLVGEEEDEEEEDGDDDYADEGEEEGQEGDNENGEQAEEDDNGQVDAGVADFGDDGGEQKEEVEDDDEVVMVVREEVEKAVEQSIEKETKGSEAASAMDDSSCDVMCVDLEDSCEEERVIPVELIDSVTEQNVLKEKAAKESDDGCHQHLLDDLGVYFQTKCIGNESPAYSRDYLSVLELDVTFAESSDRIDVDSQQSRSETVVADHDESGAAAVLLPTDGNRDEEDLIRFSQGHDQMNGAPETKEITDLREKVVSFVDGVIREEPMVQFQGCEEIPLSASLDNDYDGDAEKDIVSNVLQVEVDQEVEQRKDSSIGNDNCIAEKDVLYTVSLPEEDQELEQTKDSPFGDDNGHTQKDDVRIVLLEENRVLEETNDSTIDDDSGNAHNDASRTSITEENEEIEQTIDPAVDDARKDSCTVLVDQEDQEQAADSAVSVDKGDTDKENDSLAKEDGGLGQTSEPAMEEADCCPASEMVVAIEKMEERTEGLSIASEFNDLEEEKAPDTPTYIEDIHTLQKRSVIDRKDSGTESFDGSVVSELEGGEAVIIERLKSALKTERKALNALYAELEEERNAAAIAANQTMAMITRLQEEKAAMQMEALQYQRMMEEQSEYDQEALQLMNELVVKREKEKQELEKELELYRKKVLRYGAREKRMRKKKSSESGENLVVDDEVGRVLMSSPSSSAWDSDKLSVDSDVGDDGSDGILESNQNTPVDVVLESSNGHENTEQLTTLDESLADFEQERDSILEQLKALEERLFTLSDKESTMVSKHTNGNDRAMVPGESDDEDLEEAYHEGMNDDHEPCHENADTKGLPGHFSSKRKHLTDRKYTGPKPKRLLPLFDATTGENGTEEQEEEDGFSHLDTQFSEHAMIQEEVKEVYERLQALEADREFLQHSINSLKKGGKGIGLLRQILQNLRDLRAVELRARNLGDPMP